MITKSMLLRPFIGLTSLLLIILIYHLLPHPSVENNEHTAMPEISIAQEFYSKGDSLFQKAKYDRYWGGTIIAVAAIFSIGGNLAAGMLSAPRLPFALGEQRMLPVWFARIHPRYSTPANSILLHSGLCLLLALSGSFAFLAIATSLTRLIAYALSILALPRIRKSADAATRAQAYRLKGGLTIPLIALAICVWIGAHAPFDAWLMTAAWLLLGFVLYWFTRRQRLDPQNM